MVKAIPKKKKSNFSSTLLPDFINQLCWKVYEGILRDAIFEDTVTRIALSQHGFMANRSTETALIQILQLQHEALDNNPKMDVHAVFVDFTQAFDTIGHCPLLYALADMHVRCPLWLIVNS